VSPACFSHLTHSLCALANGKVVVLLEGGSFIPSLTEGVAQTVLTLIGNRVPRLPSPYKKPKDEVLQTIQKVKCILRDQWKCFE
ncbi:Histone deacetylase, partial [Caligus rogercresseyi]